MNPFEDPNGTYLALINAEGQYSLWPNFVPVPAGWKVEIGPKSRAECLAYIGKSWTDMRPASLLAKAKH